MGSTAAGASALIGSGAFSRVESQRNVTIQVANDKNAYVGYKLLDTPNSNNYVAYDENGHIFINIADQAEGGGEGVNSDSFTYFDGLFELCNQGKADATVSYELPEPTRSSIDGNWTAPQEGYDQQVVAFYYVERDSDGHVTNRRIIAEGEEILLELGECTEIGLRTVTKGIDATIDEPLIDGDVVVTADAPQAGQTS